MPVLRVCLLLQTPEHLKTETGEEAFNPDGLAQRSISLLKDTFPDIEVSISMRLQMTSPSLVPGRGLGPGNFWR